MNKKLFIISSILVISFLLLFSGFTFAQKETELSYPEIRGETITTTTTIPGFVRYVFNFSIIIAIIVVIGVLIWGGFLYLTSTGNPNRLKEAKTWIFNSVLGLIILLGSYLILYTLNPQLTILKMEPLPLTWGVVLLNDTASSTLRGITDLSDLTRELANQIALGNAKQVIGSISDFEAKFGTYNVSTSEFEKFNPVGLFILPEKRGNDYFPNDHTKVIVYSEKDFKGEKKEYSQEKGRCGVQLCRLENFDTTSPPLSLLIKETGPGIYLYADDEYTEEFYTRNSISDFRTKRFNAKPLNDNAKWIAIKNKRGITDYMAILHEDINYQGQCRIFLEKGPRDLNNNGQIEDSEQNIGNVNPFTTTTLPTFIKEKDEFGEIGDDLPSSINVFRLSDSWSGKVTICPAPNCEDSEDKKCQTFTNPIWKPIEVKKDGNDPNALGDEVRSICIDGNFAVVLFEHAPSDSNWPGKCQVFVESNPDLTSEPIGSCAAYEPLGGIFPFWRWKPCTSAIAIYPIK